MTPIEISTDRHRLDVDMRRIPKMRMPSTLSSVLPRSQTRNGRWNSCARKPCRRRAVTRNTEGVIR
jgi:hypothetical protein